MIGLAAFTTAALACGAAMWFVALVPEVLAAGRARSRFRGLVVVRPRASAFARVVGRVRRAASRDGDDEVWAAWLDAAARSARAGGSLRQALADAAVAFRGTRLGEVLVPLARDLESGVPLPAALGRLAESGPPVATPLVARALRLAVRAGGPAAVVLESAAATLHDRASSTREIRALSTQARASALVMAAAPPVFTLLAGGADSRVLGFFATGPGIACLVAGIGLDLAGAWWMARIVGAAR